MRMSLATAVRLGRLARGEGPRSVWARRRLVRAGDRGESLAINEVWDVWHAAPDAALWAALSRWRTSRAGDGLSRVALGLIAPASDVVAAARKVGHPIADIARATVLANRPDLVDAVCEAAATDAPLAAFCREHQLAPADPHRAAVYFLLTGQHEQYRLADPDHSLLATAYQGAGEDARARIRARIEPDLVRVLAEVVGRGRLTRLGDGEARYLVGTLAARRDWPGLWRLVRELPVVDAAAAVRRFDDWRPAGPDRALFDVLAAVDLAELAAAHAAIARPARVRLPVRATNGGSMSPNGRRIAVRSSTAVDVYTLSDGMPPRHEACRVMPHRCEVLALDDQVIITGSGTVPGFSDDTPGIHRVGRATSLDWTATGYAALMYDEAKTARALKLVSGGEERVLNLRTELGLPAKVVHPMRGIATDRDSDLVAFAGQGLFLARITDAGLDPLYYTPFAAGLNPTLAFSGPDRLVGMDDDRTLRVWRVAEDALHLVAERTVPGANPVDLPGAGVIVMQDMSTVGAGQRQLRYVDRDTLVDVPLLDRFNRPEDTYGMVTSPDGSWFGASYWDGVELVEATFSALAHRPLAAMTPADLGAVRARAAGAPGQARPFLDLLSTCLEHRFSTDVALGSGTTPWRTDDIAMGGTA